MKKKRELLLLGMMGELFRYFNNVLKSKNHMNLLQHLPWDVNRPYKGGDLYNCMVLDAKMTETSNPNYKVEGVVVKDEVRDEK